MASVQLGSLSLSDLSMVRLFKVFSTVHEMVEDRGFAIRKPKCIATPKATNADGSSSSSSGLARVASKPLDFTTFEKEFVVEGVADAEDDMEASGAAAGSGLPAGKLANRDAMTFRCKKEANGSSEMLMVFFSEDSQLSVNRVLELRRMALASRATSMIVVTSGGIMPATLRDVTEISCRLHRSQQQQQQGDDDNLPPPVAEGGEGSGAALLGAEVLTVQLFEESQLTFNVTRHSLTPKHFPLSNTETAAFLKEKALTMVQLPRMLLSDPAAQYFGLRRGQVVKIARNSLESGGAEHLMYRQII